MEIVPEIYAADVILLLLYWCRAGIWYATELSYGKHTYYREL